MKFTFTSEFHGFGNPKNIMEFEVDHIDDVLMYFKQFLQGSGYVLKETQHLELVEDDKWPEFDNCPEIDDSYYQCQEDYYPQDFNFEIPDDFQVINIDDLEVEPKKKKGKK